MRALTKILFAIALLFLGQRTVFSQSKRMLKKADKASVEFARKASLGTDYKFKKDTLIVFPEAKKVTLKMKDEFSYIPFRIENTQQYNQDFKQLLGRKFRNYSVSIETMGKEIQQLIPNLYRDKSVAIDNKRLSQ